jgi:hypothetical protein
MPRKKMTTKQALAKEFFSKPRSYDECRNLCTVLKLALPDGSAKQLQDYEERITDYFENEMIDLNLFFRH